MSRIDILVPDLPESVVDATVATWHKKLGDSVKCDEVLVEIETDKVVLEIPAPKSGVLITLLEEEGSTVVARQVLGCLETRYNYSKTITEPCKSQQSIMGHSVEVKGVNNNDLSPAIRRLVAEYEVNPDLIKTSCVGRRITREDVEQYIEDLKSPMLSKSSSQNKTNMLMYSKRTEKRVPMTSLRKRIAERLIESKNSTAILTTFNEVNMQPVIDLRNQYGDAFEKRHGIRLGFLSFYVKAVLEALKRFPEVNAFIDHEDVVYHNYYDVSIAVSTPRGLITPVLKDIDSIGMVEIEKKIKEFAIKGRDSTLKVEDLIGGNFTITNGGVFGSLMSTPIINPPQSAILGIHVIKDRPMAIKGKVVILPMMYLALSYDHRLIDGKEAISFLVTVKEIIEDPTRLLLDV